MKEDGGPCGWADALHEVYSAVKYKLELRTDLSCVPSLTAAIHYL